MRKNSPEALSLTEHLDELRKRLIFCIAAISFTTMICFLFVDKLRWILTRPAGNLELIFVSPPEALLANFRLAFIAGIILAMPFIIYQFMVFVLPALYKNEKKIIIPAVFMMALFFVLGVMFAYFAVFPFTIRFFIKFSSDTIVPMFTVSNYLSFATTFMCAFGLIFQMPLVFFILGRLGVVNARFLRTYRKHTLLLVLIISALLTPPDVFSQLMMTVPLMLLYELGIILVMFSQRKAEFKEANE